MIKKHQRNITGFIRKVYCGYFGVKLGDQGNSCVPYKVRYVRVEDLRKLCKGKRKPLRLGVPMIWREPKITVTINIFSVAILRVTTLKIRKLSCTRTFLQLYALLFMDQSYLYFGQQKYKKDDSTSRCDSGGDDEEFQCHTQNQSQQLFTQSELNDVIRNLEFPKEKAEL
jgi:hypothetical protein